jgi:hypothetical protein
MAGTPELTVTYDADTDSVSAKCGTCGEGMPSKVKRGAAPSDDITWLAAQFDLHMKQRHLPEYRIQDHLEA